jgi:hypothetical protein
MRLRQPVPLRDRCHRDRPERVREGSSAEVRKGYVNGENQPEDDEASEANVLHLVIRRRQ